MLSKSTRNGNRKELNFWVMPNAGVATKSILDPLIRKFESQVPDVEIKLTIHPWSLAWSQLMDVVKGRYRGPLPDVIQIGTTWAATLAYLGALDQIPSGEMFNDADPMSAYVWDPGVESEGNDSFYCLPWFTDIRVLYYRKDIFQQLGLNLESLNDWKGFYKACLQIKKYLDRGGPVKKLVAPLAFPGQKLGILMHDLAPWVWESGAQFCSEKLEDGQINTPAFLMGCEFYFDLVNEGFMPLPNPAQPQGNFFTGQCVMQFSGAWPIETYLNPHSSLADPAVAENFGVALFPAGPKGRFTFLGGSNLAVSSESKSKELAWEFIRFLSEPDHQLEHARAIGALTARLASMEKLFENSPESKRVFWDSLGHARRLPRLITLGSVEQIISSMCGELLTMIQNKSYNVQALKEQLDKTNPDINRVLSVHKYGATSGEAA